MKQEKIKRNMLRLSAAALLAVFLAAGYQLSAICYEYRKAEAIYEGLENSCVVKKAKRQDKKEREEEEKDQERQQEKRKIDEKSGAGSVVKTEAPQSGNFPALEIDFSALGKLNQEIVGWLYMESCDISYPVVQGNNNQYYLTHTATGEESSSGSIFMDAGNAGDFQDEHTVLYGHNMKNGAMFGRLKKLLTEKELCEKNPYLYIYLPTGEILEYRIFSCYVTNDASVRYGNFASDQDYFTYWKLRQGKSVYEYGAEITKRLPVLSLSTCFGTGGTQRLMVHGVLLEKTAAVSK